MKIWAELPLYPKELKSHSPFIRARRRHVPLLAGKSLQSPLEAGNAFTESLGGWECLSNYMHACKQVEEKHPSSG